MESQKFTAPIRTDVILSIREPHMQHIIDGKKNYEFRSYRLQQTVERIWFYRVAPHSRIEYVCEIEPAVSRKDGDPKLPEDGLGNKEFNEFHKDWDRNDFAYKILSVYQLDEPISLAALKKDYGVGGAPQRMVYTPASLLDSVPWQKQTKLR